MLKSFILLLLINMSLTTLAVETPRLIIENATGLPVEKAFLQKRFQAAYALFSREIGPLSQDLVISVGNADCLRTGYNFVLNKVHFCSNTNVKNHGLESVDVIHHEFFHAFLCQYKSELCGPDMRADVHEGLADYFSYLLSPDEFFGESFYLNRPFVRRYKTNWRPGLVQGEHPRGNALASRLIKQRVSLKDSLDLFNVPINEEVTDEVTGVPKSRLNRYRLGPDEVMHIEFHFSPEAQVSRVVWQKVPGISIKRISEKVFTIQVTTKPASPKIMARFLSLDGQELGQSVYYFGSKL